MPLERIWQTALLSGVMLWASTAGALPTAHELSPYEVESVAIALDALEAKLDSDPDGKHIESIEIVRLDVLEERDPVPTFVRVAGNALHTLTRERFIRREVLLGPGDRYDQARVDETERNLRRFALQFSLVLVVPIEGSTEDSVRLLVITKDVWSLRLNSSISGFGVQPNTLTLQPAETNLLGMGRTAFAVISMDPYTYWLGGGFIEPRVGGSQMAFRGEGGAAITCATGDTEGGYALFRYGKPLYTTRTRWAYQTAVSHRRAVRRLQTDASICGEPRIQRVDVIDSDEPDRVIDRIPSNITTETTRGQIALTRSFGVPIKNDIGFGLEAVRLSERTEDLSGFEPEAAAVFRRRYLGRSDLRLGPYVQYHAYTTRFHRVLNVETLGLQEDFRLGHEVFLRLYPALEELGSTRTLMGIYGSAAYTVALDDGFARPWSAALYELSDEDQSDAELRAGFRLVSPSLGFGRLVTDATFRHRFIDYFNPVVQLTGAGRLRGYDFRGFSGVDFVAYNFEIRSRGVELGNLSFGVAAFYDVGDAFDSIEELSPKSGVGGGLRVVIPQAQRQVFRLDFGVPLGSGPDVDEHGSPRVVFSFGQAFDVPRPLPDALIVE